MTTRLRVTHGETLVPGIRRVWFHSDDLSAFADSHHTDRYVKLVFPPEGQPLEQYVGVDLRRLGGSLSPEERPVVRTYTALYPDVVAGTLAVDFVLHGAEGVAGPWAVRAVAGDELLANGPGGAYAPDRDADWHLLVADEAALPAVLAALDELAEDAVVRVVVAVEDADHEPDLSVVLRRGLPAATQVTYVHRAAGGTLVGGVRSIDWPSGRVQAFVHGEAEEVMRGVRPYVLQERGLDRDQLSASGYWRRGRSEEGFREWKRAQAEVGDTRRRETARPRA
jgi:NADPH-dependent ferric siderophore reductase